MNVLNDYNVYVKQHKYYEECIHEELIVGMRVQGGAIKFSTGNRAKEITEKCAKYKKLAEKIKIENAEYFV